MATWTVVLCYALAILFSGWLLWRFSHVRWYWHLLSVLLAFGIGLMPMNENWNRPTMDLLIGSLFVLLLAWGAGELAFRVFQIHRHA